MLKNAYLFAKIGADPAENEQHFAEILPIGRRCRNRATADRQNVADKSKAGGRPPPALLSSASDLSGRHRLDIRY